MKKKRSDRPIGELKRVADFLPAPSKLVPKEHLTKITLTVDDDTVHFFKVGSQRLGCKYQSTLGIRRVS